MDHFTSTQLPSWASLLSIIISTLIVYYTGLVIYRLYFSPIAHFPGPKLAAATSLYEFYYDAILVGQYFKEIKRMHTQYGPIIRINPHELHISDPTHFTTFNKLKNLDKDPAFYHGASSPLSAFQTYPHELHRKRRAALNPFFSHANIASLSPIINEKALKVCEYFRRGAVEGTPVDVTDVFQGFTMDVISQCSFGVGYGCLENLEISRQYIDIMETSAETSHLRRMIPSLRKILDAIPLSILSYVVPELSAIVKLQRSIGRDVKEAMEKQNNFTEVHGEKKAKQTVYRQLLLSGLPPEELSAKRLEDEGVLIIGAGFLTSARALSLAFYHLSQNPSLVTQLRSTLLPHFPTPTSPPPPWTTLEHLPLLTAVVKESLRISWGTATRLPRLCPSPHLYTSQTGTPWLIPPNTVISTSIHSVLFDPEVFQDPWAFKPERWLENPELEKYFVVFGKGPRACVGMWLAFAEVYAAMAVLVRRFGFELFGTGEEEVRVERDLVLAFAAKGKGRVRVLCREVGE